MRRKKKKENTFKPVFQPVIYKKSRVERVNLLALWHKKSGKTTANQPAANENGENTVYGMVTKSKTSGNSVTEG